MVRDAGRDAGRVGGAAGRGVTMVWRIALETRRMSVAKVWRIALETRRRSRGDGLAASVARGRGLTAGRGRVRGAAESWGIGGLGGELSHLAFVKFTWSLPLLIIKQLTHEKGAGEHNLVPPGTAMCLGVA